MINQLTKAILLSISLLGLSACSSDLTGTSYRAGEARQLQNVRFGTIMDIQFVKLDGSDGGVGSLAGAAVGGIAGSNIGGGSGSAIAAIAGAVAGGVLGNMAEQKITDKQGLELTVHLEDGAYVSVVQEADPNNPLNNGDRVKVLTQSGGESRVVKVNR